MYQDQYPAELERKGRDGERDSNPGAVILWTIYRAGLRTRRRGERPAWPACQAQDTEDTEMGAPSEMACQCASSMIEGYRRYSL